MKSITALALVNAGSRYEPEGWEGISHFLEHMVFKGTTKYPTPLDLASTLDAVGAEYNAFTSKEYTGFYVKSASKDLDLALDVVSDMLLEPRLPAEDLEREKGVIVEEINMYEDTPMRHIGDVFDQVMFEGTMLGKDVIGTKETVRGLKQQDFQEYLRTWYGAGNMIVIVAGDASIVRQQNLAQKIETFFSKAKDKREKDGGKREFIDFSSHSSQTKQSKKQAPKIVLKHKKTDQAHFMFGVQALKHDDPRRFALAVLSSLFGGNMSSRLFTEIREKRGLAYYVRSMSDSFHDTGSFGVWAGVDPSRLDEALKIAKEELFHLLDIDGERAITEKEIQRAKDYLIGTTVLGLEDSESMASFYGMKYLLTKKIETPEEVLDHIRAVTLEEVQKLAVFLLEDARLYFAMIGPFEKSEEKRFEEILK